MLEYILFVIGIILLIKGGDYFVEGASALARKWGMPPLVIGLTIVAFGTSLPELFVNIFAALDSKPEIMLGNVVGSNLSNILLILGLSAVFVSRIQVRLSTIWREIPFSLLAATILLLLSLGSGIISRYDGIILLVFFCLFLYYVWDMVYRHKAQGVKEYVEEVPLKPVNDWLIAVLLIGGMAALYLGGRWTVDGAVAIARQLGMGEYAISATIIAVGTSLPELVTSIIAARKGKPDLAVGNLVGSNIFNILFVLGISTIILPVVVSSVLLWDLVFLICSTALLFLFIYIGRKGEVQRWMGVVFVLLYLAYVLFVLLR